MLYNRSLELSPFIYQKFCIFDQHLIQPLVTTVLISVSWSSIFFRFLMQVRSRGICFSVSGILLHIISSRLSQQIQLTLKAEQHFIVYTVDLLYLQTPCPQLNQTQIKTIRKRRLKITTKQYKIQIKTSVRTIYIVFILCQVL